MAYLTGQPVLILKEGATRSRGREAQRSNITAAKIISEVVKSTLGPRGMDKMLVDSLGDVTVTNDGATILGEIDVQNPAAKMMVIPSRRVLCLKDWAKYEGRRTLKQHGMASAITPATKATITYAKRSSAISSRYHFQRGWPRPIALRRSFLWLLTCRQRKRPADR